MAKKTKSKIFLPIETQARELNAKLLIGIIAANKGFDVYIGWKEYLRKQPIFCREGYILEKSASPGTLKIFESLKNKNFKIGVLDEEGLLYLSDLSYAERRLDCNSLKLADQIFTWGKRAKNIVEKYVPNEQKKVFATGNPRLDLLQNNFYQLHQKNLKVIKSKYSKYILINTSFGICNWKAEISSAEDYLLMMQSIDKLQTEEHKNELISYFAYKLENMYAFKNLILDLAGIYPDLNIIVRPHPVENKQFWINASHNLRNVKVISEFEVTPWILGADLVIQNDCTTGVEAALLGTKVINFVADPIKGNMYELLRKMTLEAHTSAEVRNIYNNRASNQRKEHEIEFIDDFISNFQTNELAANSIVTHIVNLLENQPKQKYKLKILLSIMVSRLSIMKTPKHRNNKFPGLKKHELSESIKALEFSMNVKKTLKIKKISHDLFLLRVRI